MENKKEINLSEIVSALLRKLWLIVLCAVIAGAGARIYTENFVTPMYRSSVSIYVNNSIANNNNTGNSTGISASDLATSQRLVLTYIEILRSNSVLDKVAEKVRETDGIYLSAAGIRGMMTAGAKGETEVFEVSISSSDPKLAAKVANAIADVAPSQIAYYVEGSSTKIVDYALESTAPYSPNISSNTTIGMIAGALLAIGFVSLQTLLDVRVKGEEDLAAISSAPVLGMIPDLGMEMKSNYGYKSGYRSSYRASSSQTPKAAPENHDKEETDQ